MQPDLVNRYSGPTSSLPAHMISGDQEEFAFGLLDVPFQSEQDSNQYDFTQLGGLEETSFARYLSFSYGNLLPAQNC